MWIISSVNSELIHMQVENMQPKSAKYNNSQAKQSQPGEIIRIYVSHEELNAVQHQ